MWPQVVRINHVTLSSALGACGQTKPLHKPDPRYLYKYLAIEYPIASLRNHNISPFIPTIIHVAKATPFQFPNARRPPQSRHVEPDNVAGRVLLPRGRSHVSEAN
jgi:hypothetical protein